MKKTLLATALIGILGATLVHAATDNAAVDARVEQMKSEFSLDDQQAKGISAILAGAVTPKAATTPEADKAAKKAARMEKRMERRLSKMKEQLGLSDEQVAQMKTVMTRQHTQMQALMEQGKTNMTAVLTPEQVTKFEAMKGEKGDHMGRGQRGGHGKNKMRGGHGGKHGGSCGDKNSTTE